MTRLLTVAEAAERLRVTRPTVYALFDDGLPSLKLRRRRLVRESDLEALVERRIVAARAADAPAMAM